MADQDTVINTGNGLIDGGTTLNQNDLGAYIKVLIDQRNDANDLVAVYRTKCVSYVSAITALQENGSKFQKEAAENNLKYESAKKQLDELKKVSVEEDNLNNIVTNSDTYV